jgi:hypothetical protein
VRASILIVSHNEMLLFTRARLLAEWLVDTANPAQAFAAIEAKGYDLLILCQTIPNDTASALTSAMATRSPGAAVMILNQQGQNRHIGTIQCSVDPTNPRWLPDGVSKLLGASRKVPTRRPIRESASRLDMAFLRLMTPGCKVQTSSPIGKAHFSLWSCAPP